MTSPDRPHLNRVQRYLVGIVAAGAVAIAGIGFAGSYAAVRRLALAQGFGQFAQVFPVGVDAGIVVLLALDLLLTWLRIPFPLLRYAAWLLTVATIAFNGATAWPDPVGVGMHGIIPVLFVVCVEAGRHAVGRIADITADRAMDSIRAARWLLAPWPTFRLWRRMKLWELRSYDVVVAREQERLVYAARLRARYGRRWRSKAPVEAMIPLRLARHGIAVSETLAASRRAATIICAGPAGLFPARLTVHSETPQVRLDRATETPVSPTPPAIETPRAETPASFVETPRETPGETRSETPAVPSHETPEAPSRPVSPRPSRKPSQTKTAQVTAIRDPQTAKQALLDLLWSRGSADKVSIPDAETATGLPRSTAAKRLATAKQHFAQGHRDINEMSDETPDETDAEPEPAAASASS